MRSTRSLVEIHNTTAKRDVMSISGLFLAICEAVLSHCFCISIPFSLLTRRKLSFLSPRDNWNLLLLSFYVFLLALLVEYIFLEGIWPIFQSSIHITLYNFFQILTCSWWPSVGSFHVLHLHLSFWFMCLCSKFEFKLWNNTLSLTRIWTLINRSEYQANALPTELSWLGFFKIREFWFNISSRCFPNSKSLGNATVDMESCAPGVNPLKLIRHNLHQNWCNSR